MSEVKALGQDADYLPNLARSTPELWTRVAAEKDPYHAAFLLAVADYFWQIVEYAIGIHALLEERLEVPLIAVQRALFEAAVGMEYLRRHDDRDREATILLAYAHMKNRQEYAHQPELVYEANAILDRMPADAVAEAQSRVAARKLWSGKTIREMATTAKFRGYDQLYGALSGIAHANRAGRSFRILPTADGIQVHMGSNMSDKDRESSANYARRILHVAFKFMWSDLGATPLQLRTTDPEEWLRRQETETGDVA